MLKFRLLLLFVVLNGPQLARAASGPTYGGPIGSTDLGNAYLPPLPGFYFGSTVGYGWSSQLYNNSYKSTPASAHSVVGAGYLMYVYPFKVLGGNLASGLEEGYQTDADVRIQSTDRPALRNTGWLDTYVDFLNWSRYVGPLFGEGNGAKTTNDLPYGLTVKAEYSMIFPTGHYDQAAIVNPSGGTFFYIPNAAVTYLTPRNAFGEGIEFNLHAFLDIQSNNWATNYQSGKVLDLDYAVGQRLGNLTVGATGSYTVQVDNDVAGPTGHKVTVAPDGNRLEAFTLGPIATLYVPSWRMSFKLKVPFSVQARNTLGINAAYFSAFFKF